MSNGRHKKNSFLKTKLNSQQEKYDIIATKKVVEVWQCPTQQNNLNQLKKI